MDDAHPRVVEHGGHGRAPRLGANQCLADADELPDMGQQPRDRRDPRRPPAVSVDGIAEAPDDGGPPSGPSRRAFTLFWPPGCARTGLGRSSYGALVHCVSSPCRSSRTVLVRHFRAVLPLPELVVDRETFVSKDSGRYKVANCTQAQPVFYGFAGLPDGKVILVSVLNTAISLAIS